MSEHIAKANTMAKDTIIYMLAKGTEGIFGIVTISLYTYYFVESDYGRYAVLNTTSQILSMLCIQWLLQSGMRYINDYDVKGKLDAFYSTTFWAWLTTNALFSLVFTILIIGLSALFRNSGFFSDYPVSLMFLMIGVFISYNTSQLLTALLAARRKVKLNLILSMLSIIGRLLALILMVALFGSRIEWIFVSNIIFDAVISIVAVIRLNMIKYISYKNKSKETLKEFFSYGFPLIGNLITTTTLNNSDKYIIQGYLGNAEVGIYSPNYTLVSTSFTMISTAVMRGSYPTILRTHSEGKKELTEKLISKAVRNYLLISVPAVTGVWAMAESMTVLFQESFRSGYKVMFWVALGMLFLGLTEYSNKIWELNSNTKMIFKNSLIGGIVNVVLNLLLIKGYGYIVAAYSTFAGFFVYFLLSKYKSRKYFKWSLGLKTYASILGSSVIMALVLRLLQTYYPPDKVLVFAYIALGALIYVALIVVSGEVKEEINTISIKLKSKKGQ